MVGVNIQEMNNLKKNLSNNKFGDLIYNVGSF